jgi:MFS family permease
MFWVVSQNASAGVMALISGTLADKFGYRLTMRIQLLVAGCCPLVAIALATWADPKWFVILFILLGVLPVTFRSLDNYCLELTEPSRHAQYISTLKMFMPITLLISPLVGLLIDHIGFAPVFITIGLVNLSGMVMTFLIDEPRHWPKHGSSTAASSD